MGWVGPGTRKKPRFAKTLGFAWLCLAFLGFFGASILAFVGFLPGPTLAFLGFPWLSAVDGAVGAAAPVLHSAEAFAPLKPSAKADGESGQSRCTCPKSGGDDATAKRARPSQPQIEAPRDLAQTGNIVKPKIALELLVRDPGIPPSSLPCRPEGRETDLQALAARRVLFAVR